MIRTPRFHTIVICWLYLAAAVPSARADETGYPVYCVAYSPSGEYLAAGGGIDKRDSVGQRPVQSKGALRVLHAKTLKEKAAFRDEFQHLVRQCTMTNDDTVIALAAHIEKRRGRRGRFYWIHDGMGIWSYSITKNARARPFILAPLSMKGSPHTISPYSVDWPLAYDWRAGLVYFYSRLVKVDAGANKVERVLGAGYPGLVCISPDAKRLLISRPEIIKYGKSIISQRDPIVRLYDTKTGKRTSYFFIEGAHFVVGAAFSPDGKTVALSGKNDRIYILSADLKQTKHVFNVGHHSRKLVYSPDGKYLATRAAPGTVKIYEAATGKLFRTFKHEGNVTCFAFSPDRRTLAVGANVSRPDAAGAAGFIHLWDLSTKKKTASVKF